MDCSIAALIACFSWANVYVDSSLSVQDSDAFRYFDERAASSFRNGNGDVIAETRTRWIWSDAEAMNPYGRMAIGYELNFRSLSWRIEASHTSSLNTDDDKGINALTLSARWYPFR